jgi:D-sedoheptulose 7-phosphate isomerase
MGVDEFAKKYSNGFFKAIEEIEASDGSGNKLGFVGGIELSLEILKQLQQANRRIYIVGNGGSAAIASHAAIDFWKNAGIPALTFNDSSLLTCISNDIGFEDVFAAPLQMFASSGDLVICVSSSGNSADIVKACETAIQKGCNLITLSGFLPDNKIRLKGNINFYVNTLSYGFAEIIHQYILHCILDAKMYCEDGIDIFNKNLKLSS